MNSSNVEHFEYSLKEKRIALLVSSLGSFLNPFMGSSINIALPSIGIAFSMDNILLNWVSSIFLLSSAIFLVPFGKIADIHGRKKIFKWGILGYMVSSLICAISISSLMLIIIRFIQGLFISMVTATSIAIITSIFKKNERGKAIGINIAAVYIGLTLGPPIGGILVQNLGWQWIFLINVLISGCAFIFTIISLKGEWAEAKNEKLDIIGSILYGGFLLSLMIGMSQLRSFLGFVFLMLSIIGIIIFIYWEQKVKNPVLNISLFKDNKVFAFSNLAALINYMSTFAIGFLLSLYLQYILNLTPQEAGFILLTQPIVQATLSPLAGRLSDKKEPQIIASIGMGLLSLGLIMLIFTDELTPLSYIISCQLILGLGYALFSSPNTNAVMGSIDKRYFGIASATISTMRLIGQTLSMQIVLLIFTLIIGPTEITPIYYGLFNLSMKIALLTFAIFSVFGIFASLARGKGKKIE
ncbi:MAG: MFS transporter [Promethearchaeota archaeon]